MPLLGSHVARLSATSRKDRWQPSTWSAVNAGVSRPWYAIQTSVIADAQEERSDICGKGYAGWADLFVKECSCTHGNPAFGAHLYLCEARS